MINNALSLTSAWNFIVMIRPVILKIKNTFLVSLLLFAVSGFGFIAVEYDWLGWGNRCLTEAYDTSADAKLKKLELSINEDAFLRLRKTYQNGKQEYFSLQLQHLSDFAYLGSIYKGTLRLKAKDEDIIVQTFNDKKGNIDSMATVLDIPLKNIEPERLDSLQKAFSYLKSKGL